MCPLHNHLVWFQERTSPAAGLGKGTGRRMDVECIHLLQCLQRIGNHFHSMGIEAIGYLRIFPENSLCFGNVELHLVRGIDPMKSAVVDYWSCEHFDEPDNFLSDFIIAHLLFHFATLTEAHFLCHWNLLSLSCCDTDMDCSYIHRAFQHGIFVFYSKNHMFLSESDN